MDAWTARLVSQLLALGEQHLHLLAALLDLAQVIEDHDLEAVKASQLAFQFVVAFGAKQRRVHRLIE